MHRARLGRREFVGMVGGAMAGVLGGAALGQGRRRPPNVVLMFSDDQGTLDMGCYGAEDLHTPHMDALAERGTRFSQAYVGASVCSPSRASLLTGRYPIRAGVPGNVGPDNGLPTDQVTMAEMMRDAGYRTALFGKWHLGHRPGMLPLDQGFDEFYGHRGGCIDNYSHFFYWNGPNRHDLWRNNEEVWEDGRYFPDLVVREARRFMAENAERPFFLYLPFNIPHYPLQGKAKYRRMYEGLDAPRSEYAALVSTLDEKVGEVVGKVDQLGLREDTLIVFISDHGHSTEVRTHGGGGYAGDYRGSKFSLWEGGLRVPAVASLPGVIPENEVRDQACMSMDWLPTIAELTGATLPARRLDGRSLAPVLKSDDAPAPRDVMHWQQGMQWAARDGDWKLVVNGVGAADDEKEFLSDLSRDATERKNIAREHPEAVARLRGLHEGWAEDVKVQ